MITPAIILAEIEQTAPPTTKPSPIEDNGKAAVKTATVGTLIPITPVAVAIPETYPPVYKVKIPAAIAPEELVKAAAAELVKAAVAAKVAEVVAVPAAIPAPTAGTVTTGIASSHHHLLTFSFSLSSHCCASALWRSRF